MAMSMQAVADWISQTWLSETIQNKSWIVPTVQSIHICAITVVVGAALVNELRLAGLLATDEAPITVIRRYLPWMWGALVVLLLSGILMVWGEPERSLGNPTFWLKMGLVFAGFVLSLLFRRPMLNPQFEASGSKAWLIKPV